MGQYHYLANLTKKQIIHPHKFGDGLKLLEFGSSGNGTMLGLAVLLACSNNRGGGDLYSDNPIVGSWAGDSIAIIGDYAEVDDFKGLTQEIIDEVWGNDKAESTFTDISEQVIKALLDDEYIRDDFLDTAAHEDYRRKYWLTLFTAAELDKRKSELNERREKQQKELRPDIVVGI